MLKSTSLRRATLAGESRAVELAIADSRGINLRARTAQFCKFLLARNARARPLFTGNDKSARFLPMSERRTSVRVRRYCRSIDSRGGKRVSAVNVPACSRRAAIRRIRARGMIYGKTRKSARGLYGSCLDSRVVHLQHLPSRVYQPCLPVPLLFLRRIKGLRRTLRIRHIIAVAHDLHIVPRVAI